MKTTRLLLVVMLASSGLGTHSPCDGKEPKQQGVNAERRSKIPSGPVFHGMSDASAAVAVDEETFVVADDENNVLRVYKTDGGRPVARFDLTRFLRVAPRFPEADIEGAARIGDRVYWITSHGRNRNGKPRPNRYRFFATKITVGADGIDIRGIGLPYTKLAEKLADDKAVSALCPDLAARIRPGKPGDKGIKHLAPKREGLNMEGLCAAPDGKTLYIGLRNPRAADKTGARPRAIVVPLKNAAQVIEAARHPVFGKPLLWDLAGLGIRSMEYSPRHRACYIIAGPHDGQPGWALYRWSGAANAQPVLLKQTPPDRCPLRPEALIVFRNTGRLLLLSDDGTLPIPVSGAAECLKGQLRDDGTCLNKHLRDEKKRHFRGIWLQPPASIPPGSGRAAGV